MNLDITSTIATFKDVLLNIFNFLGDKTTTILLMSISLVGVLAIKKFVKGLIA